MVQNALALLAPVALIGVIGALSFAEPPKGSEQMLNIALGALIALANGVYGYYFGSSKGSRDKDVLLRKEDGKP